MSWVHSVEDEFEAVQPLFQYVFDNSDDTVTFDAKAFDPNNPEFELEGWFNLADYDGTLFSQNISDSSSGREFQIYKISSGIKLVAGGSLRTILNDATKHNQEGLWNIKLYGNAVDGFDIDVSFNGELQATTGWTNIGSTFEPGALPKLAARSSGTNSANSSLLGGTIKDFKFWRGGDRTTGELVIDLPINEGPEQIVTNRAVSLVATANNFDTANWSER